MHFRGHDTQKAEENVKVISSCCIGEIIALENLPNDAFSSLILGDGFGVIPSDDKLTAPVSGVVKDVSENMRDVTIKSDDGFILIVSVGVNVSSKPFKAKCLVKPSERVDHSTVLWNIDIKDCIDQGRELAAAVIVTNSDALPSFNIRYGTVKNLSQPVMEIKVK